MENASKALIIAGAILLSILIIALGIYVFNMAKSATNTDQLDKLEVSQFNQVFTVYRGSILGSGVRDLIDQVLNNAAKNKDVEERLPDIVYLTGSGNKIVSGDFSGTAASANGKAAVKSVGMKETDIVGEIVSTVDPNTKTDNMSMLSSKLVEKHYYTVDFHTNAKTGLIDYIMIKY